MLVQFTVTGQQPQNNNNINNTVQLFNQDNGYSIEVNIDSKEPASQLLLLIAEQIQQKQQHVNHDNDALRFLSPQFSLFGSAVKVAGKGKFVVSSTRHVKMIVSDQMGLVENVERLLGNNLAVEWIMITSGDLEYKDVLEEEVETVGEEQYQQTLLEIDNQLFLQECRDRLQKSSTHTKDHQENDERLATIDKISKALGSDSREKVWLYEVEMDMKAHHRIISQFPLRSIAREQESNVLITLTETNYPNVGILPDNELSLMFGKNYRLIKSSGFEHEDFSTCNYLMQIFSLYPLLNQLWETMGFVSCTLKEEPQLLDSFLHWQSHQSEDFMIGETGF